VLYDMDGVGSLSLGIAVLVVLLWGAVWLLRRGRSGPAMWGSRDCTILRSLVVGPRERLLVVRIGTRQLVVGVGSASVSLLCELDEPLPPVGTPEEKFGEAIRKAVGRWRVG
jgi:flagellar protein FliO/FliZ